jgi:hypothetical protein
MTHESFLNLHIRTAIYVVVSHFLSRFVLLQPRNPSTIHSSNKQQAKHTNRLVHVNDLLGQLNTVKKAAQKKMESMRQRVG